MTDTIRRVDYYYVTVPDQPGEGLKVLGKLKEAGVNLLSFTAFPLEGGKAQIDIVPDPRNADALSKAVKSAGLTLSPRKEALFIQGKDRVGAVAVILKKLADAKVNMHAGNATCTADGGFGLILWTKGRENLNLAEKALREG